LSSKSIEQQVHRNAPGDAWQTFIGEHNMSDEKKKISLPIAGSESLQEEAAPKTRQEGGDVMSELEKMITENHMVLFMKGSPQQPMCGFSARASAMLASYNKPYIAVNVLSDPEIRQGIKDYGDWPTIPQLYIGGELVGGSDIIAKMHEGGELEPMIKDAFGEDA
jgi:monothiol glutaredoxin